MSGAPTGKTWTMTDVDPYRIATEPSQTGSGCPHGSHSSPATCSQCLNFVPTVIARAGQATITTIDPLARARSLRGAATKKKAAPRAPEVTPAGYVSSLEAATILGVGRLFRSPEGVERIPGRQSGTHFYKREDLERVAAETKANS